MHQIGSPFGRVFGLKAILSFSVSTLVLTKYAVAGFEPPLVLDFIEDYYRTGGSDSTFDDALNFSRAGNATMVDSDGLLKWAPHNLVPNSVSGFTGSGLTLNAGVAPDGSNTAYLWVPTSTGFYHNAAQGVSYSGQVTFSVYAKSFGHNFVNFGSRLTGGATALNTQFSLVDGSVTLNSSSFFNETATFVGDGWWFLEITTTDSTVQGFVVAACDQGNVIKSVLDGTGVYFWGAHLYRSDLGGMVDNPATGNSYVPTTTAARYLPRVGHHIWNGSAWVDEGYFHESEARTNLLTYSSEFDNAAWTKTQSSVDPEATTAPDGTQTADKFEDAVTGNNYAQIRKVASATSSGLAYTWTVYAKAEEHTFIHLNIEAGTYVGGVYFNLSTGQKGTEIGGATGEIVSLGSGWYRCSVSFVANTAHNLAMYSSDSDNTIFATRAIGFGIYIWGAQLEEGSTPSSYIPTAGATVTRAADAITVPSANLPWPTPNVIGEELVTNGTFDTDVSGWTGGTGIVSATVAAVSGNLRVTQTGMLFGFAYTTLSGLTVGKVYVVRFDAVAGNPNIYHRLAIATAADSAGSGSEIATSDYKTSAGTHQFTFVATQTTHYINAIYDGSASETADFDNISVREIDPLSVSIQMDGKMTYADEGVFTTVRLYDWSLDADNNIIGNVTTESAFDGQMYFTQEASGVSDNVNIDAFNPGINVPFNIASRHGSNFINGAVDDTALTVNTTPTALPDLSSTDLNLAFDYMGTIKKFRAWSDDLGDSGIEEAST